MTSNVPSYCEINDMRLPNQFKSFTFSKFKKSEVRKQMIENMKRGKIEPACYWCAELVCSGHFNEIWESLLHYTGKYIHLGNPGIIVYLERRMNVFKNIISQGHFLNEIELRNNSHFRRLFAEVICVLATSNKKHSFEAIKIKRAEEFDITQMSERLIAPSVIYATHIYLPKDPKEIMIPLNELGYNLSSEKRNMTNACYWIEWIMEFDVFCKRKKEQCFCEKRAYDVELKFQRDIIWMVWDMIIHYCQELDNNYIGTIMNSLLELFCMKFTSGTPKKRRYLLYFAVALITEHVPTDVTLITDKILVHTVTEKINSIYTQIKQNEERPTTDYLYNNLDRQNNFEESMRRMEMMNNIMGGVNATGDDDFDDS